MQVSIQPRRWHKNAQPMPPRLGPRYHRAPARPLFHQAGCGQKAQGLTYWGAGCAMDQGQAFFFKRRAGGHFAPRDRLGQRRRNGLGQGWAGFRGGG